jgi:uncharacterized protein
MPLAKLVMDIGAEPRIRSRWSARPGSFVALMALYESNFLRLAQLCGDPSGFVGERVSRVRGGCDLRLVVLEQSVYTTTIGLTHIFEKGAAVGEGLQTFQTYPDVRVRLYCDAGLAQAQHWPLGQPEPLAAQPLLAERELAQRWQYNNMLNKWLEYCLDLGHSLVYPVSRFDSKITAK